MTLVEKHLLLLLLRTHLFQHNEVFFLCTDRRTPETEHSCPGLPTVWVCMCALSVFVRAFIPPGCHSTMGGGGRPGTQCSPFWEISVRKRNYRIRWEGLDSFSSVVYILTFYIIYRSQCETLINAAVCKTGNN